jgi:hypothetical protein
MSNLTELNTDIRQLKEDGLTYLTEQALAEIKKTVRSLEANNVEGIFIETGCALGGSAILISLNKNPERPFFVYDVFGMIPPPSDSDGDDVKKRYEIISSGRSSGINNKTYYGYVDDLKSAVVNNFNNYGVELDRNNIHLVQGLYQDTLKIDQKVAFAHIDCDWYESVMTCLTQIVPHLSTGGKIIIDDYYDWSGCRTATDEYFKDKQTEFKLSTAAGKLHVERVG